MTTASHQELQHETSLGIVERLRRWGWGLLEFAVSPFALVLELFWHANPGRRYFSLLGVLVTYFLILLIYQVGSVVAPFVSNPQLLKPEITLDPMGLQRPVEEPRAETDPNKTVMFYWSLRLFLVMAVGHKLAMLVRKMRGTEPALTVYSGDSRIQFLLEQVPWLRAISVTDEDACKRFIEPTVSYVLATWVITPFVDPLTGAFYGYCAIALGLKAYCVRTRHQFAMDDLNDVRAKWVQLFEHLEEQQRTAGGDVVRARAG